MLLIDMVADRGIARETSEASRLFLKPELLIFWKVFSRWADRNFERSCLPFRKSNVHAEPRPLFRHQHDLVAFWTTSLEPMIF